MSEKEWRAIELWIRVLQRYSGYHPNHCEVGRAGPQQECHCVCGECGKKKERRRSFLPVSTSEDPPLQNDESRSTALAPFPSPSLSFLLCGSWRANLNLFRCDITQQFYSCGRARPLGSPGPLRQLWLSAIAGTGSWALALHTRTHATLQFIQTLSSCHFPHIF